MRELRQGMAIAVEEVPEQRHALRETWRGWLRPVQKDPIEDRDLETYMTVATSEPTEMREKQCLNEFRS